MFPPSAAQGPPMGGMQGPVPGGSALAQGLDQPDPSTTQAPMQLDPALIQQLLLQMQQDGLEGGMQPEAQVTTPDMDMMTMMGGMGGLGMSCPPGMPCPPGMGGMGGMSSPFGSGLGGPPVPPAFGAAQQLAQQRLPGPIGSLPPPMPGQQGPQGPPQFGR